MEIREYSRILRSNWWIIALVALIGIAGGVALTMLTAPKYVACARLFVTTEGGTSVGEAYQNNLFSQERVTSYASLATSAQVAQRAVDQLQLTKTAEQLRSKVTATPVEGTVLLDLCVADSNPTNARLLTNAVAGQLTQLVEELETSQRGGTPAAGATVVDDADQPSSAVSPKLASNLATGLGGGLVLGVLLALARGLLDRSLRDRSRVEQVGGTSVIGGVPTDKARPTERVADLEAGSPLAEPLRSLRTNLLFVGGGKPPKVIAITSPNSGAGRTSMAIDLAAVLDEAGHSVVLVGGDLRDGGMARILGCPENRGLSTLLSGQHVLDDVVVTGLLGNVSVLPAGPIPPNPSELLGSPAAVAAIATLRDRFDYVIIDTPPLLGATDGAVVGALVDGVLVLIRVGSTTRDQLARGLKALGAVGATVLGTVMTFEGNAKRDKKSPSESMMPVKQRGRHYHEPAEDSDSLVEAKSSPN